MSTGGRGVWCRKTRVDEARSLDILDLQRRGFFSNGPGSHWVVSWGQNSIACWYEPKGLRVMYSIKGNKNGEKKECDYIIPVVTTNCNFGGTRKWFICPLSINGRICRRRCRIIYMANGSEYFGCRECHQLTYESRQRHREKFYEFFEKPFSVINATRENVNFWGKDLEENLLKIHRAQSTIMGYLNRQVGKKHD